MATVTTASQATNVPFIATPSWFVMTRRRNDGRHDVPFAGTNHAAAYKSQATAGEGPGS